MGAGGTAEIRTDTGWAMWRSECGVIVPSAV